MRDGATPRVLLCGRPDLLRKPGGDTFQITSLQRALGPGAGLSLELEPDPTGYDLVHLFNLSRPLEPCLQCRAARGAGVPVILTTIFQDLERYNASGRRGLGRGVRVALGGDDHRVEDARALLNLSRAGLTELMARPRLVGGLLGHALGGPGASARDLQLELLANSSALVFNSDLEADAVARCFGPAAAGARAEVVPVGIDPHAFQAPDAAPFTRRFGLKGYVLSLGRIEDLKNQLSLVEALEPLDLPLVMAGGVNPRHRGYARAVGRAAAARPDTHLVGPLVREMVPAALAAARVHVLPSWFETAGLASLEAAAAGCAVVSTDVGYARAYLGDEAEYCDPGDPASIRGAVERALERGPSARLRRRVMERFTVDRGAEAMAGVYRRAAAAAGSGR